MPADQTLSLSIKVNTDTGALEVLGAKFKETADAGASAESSFAGLTKGAGELLAAFGITASIGAFISFLKEAVSQATADEEAMHRLQFAVEAQGNSWNQAKGQIKLWSEAIQEQTRFSNTEALDSLGKLSTATTSVAQAQQATQVAMGLSVAKALPLNEAVDLMRGLMMGNQRSIMLAHRELGSFTDGATTAQGILAALNKHFADLAITETGTAKAQLQFKNAWDDFLKMAGNALLPTLASILHGLTTLMGQTEKWAVVTKDAFMVSLEAAKLFARVSLDVLSGSWRDAYTDAVKSKNNLVALWDVTAKQFTDIESKKTQVYNTELDKRTALDAQQAPRDIAKDKERYDKLAENMRKEVVDRRNANLTVEKLEDEMSKQIEALGVQTYDKKLKVLDAEVAAKRDAIEKMKLMETQKTELIGKLGDWEIAKKKALAEEEAQLNVSRAFQTADVALQTLVTLNNMGEQGSAAEKTRAIALMALQQAVAIGWVWVGVAKGVGEASIWSAPAAVALGAAQTALLIAQFASQVQAINKTNPSSGLNVGSLPSVQSLSGGSSVGSTGTIPVVNPASGAVSQVAGTFVPSSGAGISGGNPTPPAPTQTFNVNIPQINVNLALETLNVTDRRAVLKALADEIRTASVDAITFAVTSANLANKNAQVAV